MSSEEESRNDGVLVVPRAIRLGKKSADLLDRIALCDKDGQFEADISMLDLEEWPKELVIVPRIRVLLAFRNRFTSIPSLQQFRLLEELDLSRNQLKSIDSIE
jgi:Leucine-rich repeat (LRR) protein